ncbi:hypothetical protein MINTM008_20160 [Mycobacterium intracellulare]|uniref:Uncharacterized protein n=1 Tax=Mycobacterium intracellulare TaxID=1767 RepID=A0A7R7RPA1_MYCIT|nr:hypothetical protein MINTM002_17650 [Mycobacterium intracellulare]BCO56618.1 hypothetical protein MINTM005_18620 [Mycobacterium intracellulare]BCO61921.1 hypothetical protein MINTM006_18710 [Mycobacterium intracellulare]BCO67139.1 hypothetical protein MINTM007_17500 [Mycobacterium intracellulare]BCO72681.1 hypothetical protein MINTM008_20160 [Mycobacterium intracellulare]
MLGGDLPSALHPTYLCTRYPGDTPPRCHCHTRIPALTHAPPCPWQSQRAPASAAPALGALTGVRRSSRVRLDLWVGSG